jgi:hypothetical protein
MSEIRGRVKSEAYSFGTYREALEVEEMLNT